MFSSDKSSLRRCGWGYLTAAAFCGVFGFAYEQFNHGVYSNCMILFFLIPLLGGALPSFLLLLARCAPGRLDRLRTGLLSSRRCPPPACINYKQRTIIFPEAPSPP
ncbi:hypothetical protein OBV_07450 [Oscillibacter valericigenes Sjm18-20]|nr:hypothetical protein OBV_07450 [Oscillibacter valericigenes Sjm18-20]